MGIRGISLAALLTALSGCTVSADYGGAGFACSADEPCKSGFDCSAGICIAGAPGPDATPRPDGGDDDLDAGTITCLPPIELSDEFPGAALDPQWTQTIDNGTSAVVAAGILSLSPRPGSVPVRFARVRSAPFTLEGKRVFAEIPGMVDTSSVALGEFLLASQANTFYFLRQSQGVVQFGTTIGGTELITAATAYEASDHRWWQLRVTEGRVFADLSEDGSSWVNLDSVAADVIVGDLYVEFGAGTRESVAAPGVMQVDNVNAGSGLCL